MLVETIHLTEFEYFQRPTAEPIFTHNTSNDAVPCKDVPFLVEKTKI